MASLNDGLFWYEFRKKLSDVAAKEAANNASLKATADAPASAVPPSMASIGTDRRHSDGPWRSNCGGSDNSSGVEDTYAWRIVGNGRKVSLDHQVEQDLRKYQVRKFSCTVSDNDSDSLYNSASSI